MWCLMTGQPAASWLTLTEVQRRVFYETALEWRERRSGR